MKFCRIFLENSFYKDFPYSKESVINHLSANTMKSKMPFKPKWGSDFGESAKVVPEGQTRDRARAASVTRSLRTCLSDLKTFLLFVRTTLTPNSCTGYFCMTRYTQAKHSKKKRKRRETILFAGLRSGDFLIRWIIHRRVWNEPYKKPAKTEITVNKRFHKSVPIFTLHKENFAFLGGEINTKVEGWLGGLRLPLLPSSPILSMIFIAFTFLTFFESAFSFLFVVEKRFRSSKYLLKKTLSPFLHVSQKTHVYKRLSFIWNFSSSLFFL